MLCSLSFSGENDSSFFYSDSSGEESLGDIIEHVGGAGIVQPAESLAGNKRQLPTSMPSLLQFDIDSK